MNEDVMKSPAMHKHGDRFRQGASLSLVCCLMLPAIMLLMMSLLIGSNRARQDLDATRAASQSVDAALAAFDRGLYRDFGLFAVTEAEIARISSDFLLPDSYEQNISVQESIFDNALLMDAIARHMSVRAAAGLIDEGIDRVRSIRGVVPDKITNSLTLLKGKNPAEADPNIEKDESNEEWYSEYSDYVDKEYRNNYHDSLLGLSPVYIPDSKGGGTVEDFDPYKVSSLEKLAQGLDTMMFTLPEGFTDQFLLTEYSLSYFGTQVTMLSQNGVTRQYRTPDGRLLSKFSESRQYEQEMIATGATGDKAARNVRFFISGCRIVIHLAANLLSSTVRARFDAIAAGISAGVAAISLGTVVIPPEAISAVLIISDSIAGGIKDKNKLLEGEEVKLWPTAGTNAFKVNYRDHLRLLILVQPREQLLQRISAAIRQNYGDEYFTKVSCEVSREATGGQFPRPAFSVKIEHSYFSRKNEEFE
ncbi:MAG: hypothetical protein PHR37_04145 [Eubacteriales bacterium]|nr:hypothetical protein [Eubacteriales bacterium]